MFALSNLAQGKTDEYIRMVKQVMTLEKNFNSDFGVRKPTFCNDPSLPKTKDLRGILQLIDPNSGRNGGKSAQEINQIAKLFCKFLNATNNRNSEPDLGYQELNEAQRI